MVSEPSQQQDSDDIDQEKATVEDTEDPLPAEEEVSAKRYVPTNAMSALASAMKSGLGSNTLALTKEPEEEKVEATEHISPVMMPRRPTLERSGSQQSSIISETEVSPPVLPRRPISNVEVLQDTPKVALRPVIHEKPRPFTVALEMRSPPTTLPRQRPISSFENDGKPQSPGFAQNSLHSASKSIPGPSPTMSTFERSHVTSATKDSPSSQIRREQSEASDSDSEMPMTKEERARHELARQALRHTVSPQRHNILPAIGQTLSFKRKENSTSGDDKALEKVPLINNSELLIG
jgi:hypothetical protein